MPVELFSFRYRDPRTGRWISARYRATREDIATRYAEWEIAGAGETRTPIGDTFHPYRDVPGRTLHGPQVPPPEVNAHLANPPALDAVECFLALVFLRRYVTYCARRLRLAQMEGAALLSREVANAHARLSYAWHDEPREIPSANIANSRSK